MFIILTFIFHNSYERVQVFVRIIYVQFDRKRLNENIAAKHCQSDYNLSCQRTHCFYYSLALPSKIIERTEHFIEKKKHDENGLALFLLRFVY